MTSNAAFAYFATAAVVVVVAIGFFHGGSPASQRRNEADARRVADLKQIASAVFNRKRVPASLSELDLHLADPETNRPYELLPQGGDRYKLCAMFNSPGESQRDRAWHHPPGRHCFELLSTVSY